VKTTCLDVEDNVLKEEDPKRERKACKRRRAYSRISSRTKSSLKEKKGFYQGTKKKRIQRDEQACSLGRPRFPTVKRAFYRERTLL
jgi:hypothetical protein